MICCSEITYTGVETKASVSDIAVKIHGAIMKLIPTEFAEELHKNNLQPFSMYCISKSDDEIIVRISSFTDKARIINEALLSCENITIHGLNTPIQKTSGFTYEIDIDKEIENLDKKVRMNILTPAIYRSGGRSFCTPELARFFRSVSEKYAEFMGEGDADYLCSLISKIQLTNYSLTGKSYNISGNIYNGMTGFMDIPLVRKEDEAIMLKKLLVFASFSGIGAKTAMGMGGVSLQY